MSSITAENSGLSPGLTLGMSQNNSVDMVVSPVGP
jgi:hypothetical protein